jgi:hypothetical protein
MKTYGSESTTTCVFNFGTSFMLWPLYPRKSRPSTYWTGSQVGLQTYKILQSAINMILNLDTGIQDRVNFASKNILWRARCGPTKSTEEGRCVATDSHATIEGTVVFFGVCSRGNNGLTQEWMFSLGSDPRLYNYRRARLKALQACTAGYVLTNVTTPKSSQLLERWCLLAEGSVYIRI